MPETVPVTVHLFALNRAFEATQCRSTLFCSEITLPTEIHGGCDPLPCSVDEAQAQAALADGRVLDALSVLHASSRSGASSSDVQIRFLFASAHALLNQANRVAAERTIQTALRILAEGSPLQRGLQLPEWLVLSTTALLRRDWQSCGLWLRQVERSLQKIHEVASSCSFRHAAGDLLAIRGCVFAEQGVKGEAELMLTQATECHDSADSRLSAVRDRILLSRVHMATEQYQAAELRLIEAESQLRACKDLDAQSQRLRRAIENDRRVMESQSAAVRMATWN